MTDDKQRMTLDDILGPEFNDDFPAGDRGSERPDPKPTVVSEPIPPPRSPVAPSPGIAPPTAKPSPEPSAPPLSAATISSAPVSPPVSGAAKDAALAADEALKTGQSGAPLPPVPGAGVAKNAGRIPSSTPTERRTVHVGDESALGQTSGTPVAASRAAAGDVSATESATTSEIQPGDAEANANGWTTEETPPAASDAQLEPDQSQAWDAATERLPPFPTASVLVAFDALAAWVRAWPRNTKIIIGSFAATVVILFVALAIALFGPGTEEAYVLTSKKLIEVPVNDERFAYRQVERGELVEVLDRRGEYALVRNQAGRVGWIDGPSLASEPGPVTSAAPFAMCRRRWTELDNTECLVRAQAQLEACKPSCEEADELAACLRACDQRMQACSATCELPPGAEPAGDKASTETIQPSPDSPGATGDVEVPGQPNVEGGGEATSAVEPASATDAKPSKKKKKKRKKRKKRKRR